MEEFELKGNGDFLKITLVQVFGFPENTSHSGGYDTKSVVEIKSGPFSVASTIWVSTGEIFEFYTSLRDANNLIEGIVSYDTLENDLKFTLNYNANGQIKIKGTFDVYGDLNNSLNFEFASDQSYIKSTVQQLSLIAEIYGGMKGLN